MQQQFNRVARLTGAEGLERLQRSRVIIFGLGGVGSWCAEALARTGVADLTMVDADAVALSNLNRQLPALHSTLGQPKVEVMRRRLLDINPAAQITALHAMYTPATACDFDLGSYDWVVDAIDPVADKASLIVEATSHGAGTRLASAMGAALKSDPRRLSVAEFWNVKGCPLAAALRRRFKKTGLTPRRKFKCVYSDELLPNLPAPDDDTGAMGFGKAAVNGALVAVTASAGMMLASIVVNGIAFGR